MKQKKQIGFLLASLLLLGVSCKSKCDFTIKHQSTEENATLVVIGLPETFARTTEAFYSHLLPAAGIGSHGRLRAGHACMVIVKEGGDTFEYYDCGRYIVPDGYARIRGGEHDADLAIDVKPQWEGDKLTNIEELLTWLHNHTEVTHGMGDLYAAVNNRVNYERVMEYIDLLQEKEIFPYGPFQKFGSNCARFVTGVMYHGIVDPVVNEEVQNLYQFTPSVLGNVTTTTRNSQYYVVTEDSLYTSTEKLRFKQYGILFDFGRDYPPYTQEGGLVEPTNIAEIPDDWQWLGGIGFGVWYEVETTDSAAIYEVSQFSNQGKELFSTYFQTENNEPLAENFEVIYPSTYKVVSVMSEGDTVRLERIIPTIHENE